MIGRVAYRLMLPEEFTGINDVFHVSQLKKYRPSPEHVLNDDLLELQTNLSYKEKPSGIVERSIKELREKKILMCKVLWRHHGIEEAT